MRGEVIKGDMETFNASQHAVPQNRSCCSGTALCDLCVRVLGLLGNSKGRLGIETEELLDVLSIVRLQCVSVDAVGSLQLRAESNGGL